MRWRCCRAEVGAAGPPTAPDPEVAVQANWRRFTAACKARLLAQADACTARGQVGPLLRREGLYSSHLTDWRRQRGGRPEGRKRRGWRALAGFAIGRGIDASPG